MMIDISRFCKMISKISLVNLHHPTAIVFFLVIRTLKIYSPYNFRIYIILNCCHHALQYIPVNYLFFTWKLILLTIFTHSAHSSSPASCQSLICFLYLCVCLFLYSIDKWDHTVLVFLWVLHVSIMPKSIHVASKGKIMLLSSTMKKY